MTIKKMSAAPSRNIETPSIPKKRGGFFVNRTRNNTVRMSSARCAYSLIGYPPPYRSFGGLRHVDLGDSKSLTLAPIVR